MLFSSLNFLFVFLPLTLLLFFLVPGKIKQLVLLFTSLIFYAWGEPIYVLLMIFSILFNYIAGLDLSAMAPCRARKIKFIVVVVVNFLILGFFKYAGFFVENLNAILPVEIPNPNLSLPVGISFYTFQTLSYIFDVYWGNVRAQKNIVSFAAYVTMFPQLIAGPIVRYSDLQEELDHPRKVSFPAFGEGVAWFLTGLGKKVLLANNIGQTFEAIYALPQDERSMMAAWLGAICYAFQIYFDFSGYSDMAIGLGKMMGFTFPKNFNYPYTAKSITDFWRRWHISLSTWFREYVYIPLGGNRNGTLKHLRNILIVWLLTGFWHGAAWNFIFWGLYYGLLLMIEKYVTGKVLVKLPAVFQHLITLILVLVGWVFFFSESIGVAFTYLKTMFLPTGTIVGSTFVYYLTSNWLPLLIMVLCSCPAFYNVFFNLSKCFGKKAHVARAVGYLLVFAASIAYLVGASYNPFLYFRF